MVLGDRWAASESLSVASVADVDQHMSSCCSGKQDVTGVWGGLVEFMTVPIVGTAAIWICLLYLVGVYGRTVQYARLDHAVVLKVRLGHACCSRLLLYTERRGI